MSDHCTRLLHILHLYNGENEVGLDFRKDFRKSANITKMKRTTVVLTVNMMQVLPSGKHL